MIHDSYNLMDVDGLAITDISEMTTESGCVFYVREIRINRNGIMSVIKLFSDKENGLYYKNLPEVE